MKSSWSSTGTAELAQELWAAKADPGPSLTQYDIYGASLVVQWSRLCAPTESVASIPGQ